MRRLIAFVSATTVLALLVPASALAGSLKLHPAGFGSHSYSAWKAHQGQPDSKGRDDQALYFQKQTATPTFAAGIAVVKGIEGLPAEELQGLAWDHREDGHCGAGAPRWNVTVRTVGGSSQTVFLGCNAAVHDQQDAYGSHGWCRDTQPSPADALPAGSTITGLAIVFDEGNDTPNPPPLGCGQEQLEGGFVHLDNIEVRTSNDEFGSKCWTGANDNSNQSSGPCPDGNGGGGETITTSLPVSTNAGASPSVTDLASALDLAYPGVPLTSWTLYPTVIE